MATTNPGNIWSQLLKEVGKASKSDIQRDLDLYRTAAEKAAYAQLGPQFSQGLSAIQNFMARSGPLADSGARTALAARLGSRIYGQASGQIAGGVQDFIAQLLNQRRQFMYQQALEKQRQQASKTGFGGVAGGIAGSLVGGPLGGYLGNKLFSSGGSGGGQWV